MSSKPTIYIEATALTRHKKTGVDFYCIGLFRELVKCMPHNDFVFFHFAENDAALPITGKNVKEVIITKMPGHLYRKLLFAGIAPSVEWLLDVEHIDTIIFPNFYSWRVRSSNAKIIPIIYDTAYLDTPEFVESKNRTLLKKLVASTVKRCTEVVTISESTAKALQKHYRLDDKKISVVYPALNSMTINQTDSEQLDLPKHYFLFLGTLEPRKNVANIIMAYVSLDDGTRAKYKLVLSGGKGWMDEEIRSLIEYGRNRGVIELGYITDTQKVGVYQHADIFVYPAKYEGFGMPIIEAQQYGVPVITCNNSSLPEAAGDAALYCGESSQEIAKAMLQLVNDGSKRKELARAGKTHARKFSWAKSAQKLKELLEEI